MKMMRQLDDQHKKLWDVLPTLNSQSFAENDCDPALLAGWTDRDLSLWSINQDPKFDRTTILIALCRTKKDKNWKQIGYLTFDDNLIQEANLKIVSSNGKTVDDKLNVSGTHYELKGVTGKGICTLLSLISRDKLRFEVGTFTHKQFDEIIFRHFDTHRIQTVFPSATSASETSKFAFTTTSSGEVPAADIAIEKNPDYAGLPPSSTDPTMSNHSTYFSASPSNAVGDS